MKKYPRARGLLLKPAPNLHAYKSMNYDKSHFDFWRTSNVGGDISCMGQPQFFVTKKFLECLLLYLSLEDTEWP